MSLLCIYVAIIPIHSLRFNSIGTKGAVAISEAMKKMANLQALE